MAEKIATRAAYGEALIELGAKNDKVVVLDADLANATQTGKFKKVYPDRHFNMQKVSTVVRLASRDWKRVKTSW